MTLPTFSPWLHWDGRTLYEERNSPGTYLLAQFEEQPPDCVDPVDQRILLIAVTHRQTFEGRWNQFHYSAFQGGRGHAGGVTFHGLFNNGPDTATPPWLYVSAAPAPPDAADIQEHVSGLKNRLLQAFRGRYGLLPCCNVRGPVDKFINGNDPIVQPSVQFSQWSRWEDRGNLAGMDAAGVYAIACFEGDAPSPVDILDARTVYIGETCENTLKGRLWQFNRSALLGRPGHSGGLSFSNRCVGQAKKLYVSVFPVSTLHEPLRSAFIRHTERRIHWEFVLRYGRRPACNSK